MKVVGPTPQQPKLQIVKKVDGTTVAPVIPIRSGSLRQTGKRMAARRMERRLARLSRSWSRAASKRHRQINQVVRPGSH